MHMNSSSIRTVASAVAAVCLGIASSAASAVTITPITTTTGITDTLTNALLAPSSGITLGTATYQGVNTPNGQQSGTFTGFTLAPSSGSTPTLTLPDGILLTSGSANLPLTNTVNQFNPFTPASGANAQLGALSASAGGTSSTFDANVLSFKFKLEPGQNSVSAQFVFGTDEFPTQSVTDIFGFFVDGVNFAKFPNGQLISNTPGNPTNFINNPVGGGLYGIEYNGLTQVFTVTGLLGAADSDGFHTLTIGVADTSDSIFDSGVFISSLKAGLTTDGGGGITPAVPEPSTYAMMFAGLGLVAWMARRRRRD